jgi:hypothetical protein
LQYDAFILAMKFYDAALRPGVLHGVVADQ